MEIKMHQINKIGPDQHDLVVIVRALYFDEWQTIEILGTLRVIGQLL